MCRPASRFPQRRRRKPRLSEFRQVEFTPSEMVLILIYWNPPTATREPQLAKRLAWEKDSLLSQSGDWP